MNRRFPVLVASIAAASAMAGACATWDGGSGRASTAMMHDGSIEFRVKKPGLFAGRDVVLIRPGEPGYEAVKSGLETIRPASGRKPVLRWTIGEPVYLP